MSELAGVADVFAGQSVLVTGGSGYLGKVLVEKLLRSCPDTCTVFLLLRPKRGRAVQERLQEILQTPVFAPLLRARPRAAARLVVVPGDCAEPGLGLSAEDRSRLQEEVAFVFHLGASVRLDQPLRNAILTNVRGTRDLAELAKGMRKLKALQLVSTAFVHLQTPELEEVVYYPGQDWKTLIRIAESEDTQTLNAFSQKIIGGYPLTYPFSKCLSENVIDSFRHEIPVCIFRPAIVCASLEEPFPGWVDNLNTSFGLKSGIAKGLVRAVYADPSLKLAYTFVDWAIRGVLLTSWATAIKVPLRFESDHPIIVNMKYKGDQYNSGEEVAASATNAHVFSSFVRYPRVIITTSFPKYFLTLIFSQLTYALLVDGVCSLIGEKKWLLQLNRRALALDGVLSYFKFNTVEPKMEALETIEKFLPNKDFAAFTSRLNVKNSLKCDFHSHSLESLKGIAKYVFKEEGDIRKNKSRLRILFVLDLMQYFILTLVLLWVVRCYHS